MKILRALFSLFVLGIFLCCTACSQPAAPTPLHSESAASVSVAGATQNFAPGELESHFQKHGAQLGCASAQEYLQAARTLLNALAGDDVLEKYRSNGDLLRFRISTGEFAVMSSTGRIRTYFKASYNYWLKQ